MKNILNKIFSRSKNLNFLDNSFEKLKKELKIETIFNSIEKFSKNSEIRYVGGCVRKILNNEEIDDIDLAVNLNPTEVSEVLKKNNIKFYSTGIEHGTVTALVDKKKFEITSLREDIITDGRHAKVRFSSDWNKDASRRDFTINAVYADINGNLFDPFDGKKDLENGKVNFIGDPEIRIKEDYLRILRYIRFFLSYSKHEHEEKIISAIKKNLDGVSQISSERLLDEFRKFFYSKGFSRLNEDSFSLEIIELIFPQFKNISVFKSLNNFALKKVNDLDFIFFLSILIVDGSDNTDYFMYKFNISKKDKKRINFLNNFYSNISSKTFTTKNLSKIFYYEGKQSLLDLLYFQIFRSKKIDKKIISFIDYFKDKEPPLLPLRAITLMTKYNIPEGKELGDKLKKIENKWVDNDFKISDSEIQKVLNN